MKHPTEPGIFVLTGDQAKESFLEQRLGPPKDRLMALLSKDNDIKQWLTNLLDDVIYYRRQTLEKMSNFYDEILNQKYVKPLIMQRENPQDNSNIAKIKIEYDITKICSYELSY